MSLYGVCFMPSSFAPTVYVPSNFIILQLPLQNCLIYEADLVASDIPLLIWQL
jgi:hypothetical protein